MPSPIALFVFKRPKHTQQTVESLLRNKLASESDLIVFADGPRSAKDEEGVNETRKYVRAIDGFKSVRIVESPVNKGLANSIIGGVTEVLKEYPSVVVVEDDLVCSPFFLSYMQQGMELYQGDPSVVSIHGYVFPVKEKLPPTFFLKGADCWGWATWRGAWDCFEGDGMKLLNELKERNLTAEFDFNGNYPYTQMLQNQVNGKIDSWAIRWYASAFLKNKYTLYPGVSFVNNIGNDAEATHQAPKGYYETEIQMIEPPRLSRIVVAENAEAKESISKYLGSGTHRSLVRRALSFIKRKIAP